MKIKYTPSFADSLEHTIFILAERAKIIHRQNSSIYVTY